MKTKKLITNLIIPLISILGFAAIPLTAIADNFPTKPVTLVVPYRAGGGTDTMARILAKALKNELGQPVVVVNRKGGGGSVGASYLKNSAADGYTIMMGGDDIPTWNSMTQNVDFKVKDFRYLASLAEYQNALVTRSDKPYKTLEEMIAYSKKHPGLKYASQLPMEKKLIEVLIEKNNLDWKMINVGGGSEMVQLLLGDKIDIAYSGGIFNRYPKKLTVLASLNKSRLASSPDVPSLYEIFGISMPSHVIFMAPAGIPDDVAKILEDALLKAGQSKDFKTVVEDRLKTPVIGIGAAELETYMSQLNKQLQEMAK